MGLLAPVRDIPSRRLEQNEPQQLLGTQERGYFWLTCSRYRVLDDLQNCYWTQVHVPKAQPSQTILNIRVWSRDRFIQHQARRMGDILKNPKLLCGFEGNVFIGKICGEDCRVWDFSSFWWWGNREMYPNLLLSLCWHPHLVWWSYFLLVLSKILLCIFFEEKPGISKFVLFLFFKSWSMVAIECCVSCYCTATWNNIHIHVFPPFRTLLSIQVTTMH